MEIESNWKNSCVEALEVLNALHDECVNIRYSKSPSSLNVIICEHGINRSFTFLKESNHDASILRNLVKDRLLPLVKNKNNLTARF